MRNFFYGPFLIGRMGIIRYLCLSKQKEMWVMKKTVQAWMQRMRRMPYKRRRLWLWSILLVCTGIGVTATLLRFPSMSHDFEVTDQLGGNIFPSAILSVAATEANIIEPPKGNTLGNPKSLIAVRLTAPRHHALVRIELAETPFYARSVSEFVLERRGEEYLIFPDVLWRYEALRNNAQAEPISVVATVEVNGQPWGQKVRTFSVRSINECLIGYREVLENGTRFHSTKQFYAAYVNEESPMIDPILREALNTRIVRRFLGYQGDSTMVDRQVYALWNVLQRRGFKYSSVSYSSLSSNVVYSQRVRTLEDALNSSQINCVDGSVLFASLLRAINITPVLVQGPGHMFVGYYTDSRQKHLTFLETTMIGDIELSDYFTEEEMDSTMKGKTQGEMSRLTFDRSKVYAMRKYKQYEKHIRAEEPGYDLVEISKGLRRSIQPLGK